MLVNNQHFKTSRLSPFTMMLRQQKQVREYVFGREMKKLTMITRIIKDVQDELTGYNWEERVLFFIETSLFVGLLISVVPLLKQL
jgi:hypothetical protein